MLIRELISCISQIWAAATQVLNPCLPILAPIRDECIRNVDDFVRLDSQLRFLEEAEGNLTATKATLMEQVETEMSQDQNLEPTTEVTQWLDRAEEALDQSPLLEECQGLKRCACCCCCCNVVLSCDRQLHLSAKDKLNKINQVMEQGNELTRPYTKTRSPNGSYPPSIIGLGPLVERLWSAFRNPSMSVIGVFGPGGVGKTTLLKEFKKQLESSKEYRHAVVIFFEVAYSAGTLNVADMQKAIISQLNYEWDESQGEKERATLLLNLLRGNKFVVLLDAVLSSFQLEEVGIPTPEEGSKLIVASWTDKVCTEMKAMSPIELQGLAEKEAMQLFLSNLKQDLRDDINVNASLRSTVEAIVRRCGGLPLALNVVGSALGCSQFRQVFENAASETYDHSELKNFDRLLDTLERSYYQLDEKTKKCFLYCVLFPDHGTIDNQLMQDYWVAVGLISWRAPHAGYHLISNLISACLLQKSDTEPESEVQMHYMIRRMGIRLAKQRRYVIEAGQGLRQAPADKEWTKAARISLMSNRIEKLSISSKCPSLLTLLLRNNPSLCKLDSNLFTRMPQLKVLDLSHTAIDKLPDCSALRQLKYLNLSHTNIKELPRDICDNVGELLYLNMSHTRFTELPSDLRNLQMLTHLILSETFALTRIPNGAISNLLNLRVLNLYKSHYGMLELPDLNLENLEVLHSLGITIHSEPVLDKLRNNQHLAKSTCFLSLSDCQGMQSIPMFKFENMQKLEELNIESCNGLQSIDAGITNNRARRGRLKVLNLKILSDLHQVVVPPDAHHFCSLRHLAIHACHKLVNVSWILQLHSLERLEVSECSELEEIAQEQSNGTTLKTSTSREPLIGKRKEMNADAATCTCNSNLQGPGASSSQNGESNEFVQIQGEIDDTPSIQANLAAYASTSMVREEHIGTTSLTSDVRVNQQDNAISYGGANLQRTHSFGRLRILVLKDLSKLKSICSTSDFPCLASINVRACPHLRKLPVGRMPKLKQIHGERDWWDGLPPEMKDHLSNSTVIVH